MRVCALTWVRAWDPPGVSIRCDLGRSMAATATVLLPGQRQNGRHMPNIRRLQLTMQRRTTKGTLGKSSGQQSRETSLASRIRCGVWLFTIPEAAIFRRRFCRSFHLGWGFPVGAVVCCTHCGRAIQPRQLKTVPAPCPAACVLCSVSSVCQSRIYHRRTLKGGRTQSRHRQPCVAVSPI